MFANCCWLCKKWFLNQFSFLIHQLFRTLRIFRDLWPVLGAAWIITREGKLFLSFWALKFRIQQIYNDYQEFVQTVKLMLWDFSIHMIFYLRRRFSNITEKVSSFDHFWNVYTSLIVGKSIQVISSYLFNYDRYLLEPDYFKYDTHLG